MTAKVYLVGNLKGGVGKTKNATMLAFASAVHKKEKTLIIDLDVQSNATMVMLNTAPSNTLEEVNGEVIPSGNILEGMRTLELGNEITHILPNLDLIASTPELMNYDLELENVVKEIEEVMKENGAEILDKTTYKDLLLDKVLNNKDENGKSIKDKYDRIYIDIPPQPSTQVRQAILASDYVVASLQPQEFSRTGMQHFGTLLDMLRKTYPDNFKAEFVGVVPIMLKRQSKLDNIIMDVLVNEYGDLVLPRKLVIGYQERLKRYDRVGISLPMDLKREILLNNHEAQFQSSYDNWDKKAQKTYFDVIDQLDVNQKILENIDNG